MSEIFVYHMRPVNFTGTVLYPLNRLKSALPGLYEGAKAKYQGREWLLDVRIPALDCLWNDVLHFSLMRPSVIYKGLIDAGCVLKEISWFEVPVSDILNGPSTLYLNTRPWDDDKILIDPDFEQPTAGRIRELSGMPEINSEYYRSCAARQERPLLWKRAPHLLLRGELVVANYRILNWKDETIQS